MRKNILPPALVATAPLPIDWLNLASVARVEVTSEHPDFPIESALADDAESGWQAGGPGEQIIRLIFDEPAQIRLIQLLFRETEQERTQEFSLRWQRSGETKYREIIRQQYTFSPPDTTEEAETYAAELEAVAALELRIVPEVSGGEARAVLTQLRLA